MENDQSGSNGVLVPSCTSTSLACPFPLFRIPLDRRPLSCLRVAFNYRSGQLSRDRGSGAERRYDGRRSRQGTRSAALFAFISLPLAGVANCKHCPSYQRLLNTPGAVLSVVHSQLSGRVSSVLTRSSRLRYPPRLGLRQSFQTAPDNCSHYPPLHIKYKHGIMWQLLKMACQRVCVQILLCKRLDTYF